MSKDNQMSNVWIVALKNILEVGKLQGSVDVKRNHSDILHEKAQKIKPVLVPVDLLKASYKSKKDVLELLESLLENPTSDVPIEKLEILVESIHEYFAAIFCEALLIVKVLFDLS